MTSVKRSERRIRAAIALIALSGLSAAGLPADAQTTSMPGANAITVTKDDSTARSLPATFYGVNGQQRSTIAWAQNGPSNFTTALNSLHIGLLRFPGGTPSDFWDGSHFASPSFITGGDFIGSYYYGNPPSPFLSPLSELQSELGFASQASPAPATAAVVTLNVLTDPAVEENTDPSCQQDPTSCTPTHNSPDLDYQILALETASNPICIDGTSCPPLSIPYVELGNEFYFSNPCFLDVYPDNTSTSGLDIAGLEYAELLAGKSCPTNVTEPTDCVSSPNWVSAIRSADPGAQIAAVAVDVGNATAPRILNWNQTFLSAPTIPAVDALVLHVYRGTDLANLPSVTDPALPFGTPNNARHDDVAATMLAVPFATMAESRPIT
jgi:hypothetical protein